MVRELTRRFAGRIRWIIFENQSGEDIPPFSIIEASGWEMPDPSGSDVSVTSPIILGDQREDPINPYACFMTHAVTVPAGANGVCARPTLDLPLLVSLAGSQQDPNDAPFRMCGPSDGSWEATRDMPGFAMVDLPQQGYALVVPTEGPYVGQVGTSDTSQPINVTTSGSVAVLWGTTGNETVSTQTVTCYNRFNLLPALTQVFFDWTGYGWEIVGIANQPVQLATLDKALQAYPAQVPGTIGADKDISIVNPAGFTAAAGAEVWVQLSPTGGTYDVISTAPSATSSAALVRGVLQSALTSGGSASMTTTSGTTVTVYEVLGLNGGQIAAGTEVAAFMNQTTGHLEVVSAGCGS